MAANHERATRQVRIPNDLDERLVKEADRRVVSVNRLVCRALEEFLPGLEAQELP